MSFDMQLVGELDIGSPLNWSPGNLIMETYLLAFWQKHYGLHQFICRLNGESDAIRGVEIFLSEEDLSALLEGIRSGQMRYDRQMMSLNVYTPEGDIAAIEFALKWLAHGPGAGLADRWVFYRAA
jgi:hypothetical protein